MLCSDPGTGQLGPATVSCRSRIGSYLVGHACAAHAHRLPDPSVLDREKHIAYLRLGLRGLASSFQVRIKAGKRCRFSKHALCLLRLSDSLTHSRIHSTQSLKSLTYFFSLSLYRIQTRLHSPACSFTSSLLHTHSQSLKGTGCQPAMAHLLDHTWNGHARRNAFSKRTSQVGSTCRSHHCLWVWSALTRLCS